MKWIDFEKDTPNKPAYYLCQIWGVSVNTYGAFTCYRLLYWNDKFVGYPIVEYGSDGEVWDLRKITWWTEIEGPPINTEHHKIPPAKMKVIE